MDPQGLDQVARILQLSITPVALISGVGLLLLSMTNRLGRAIDRARQLAAELRQPSPRDRNEILAQVNIIYRRARLLRLTIALAALSVLLAGVLIISLFLTALMHWENGVEVSLVFIACLAALIASLVTFIYDIHLSLVALKLELRPVKPDLK